MANSKAGQSPVGSGTKDVLLESNGASDKENCDNLDENLEGRKLCPKRSSDRVRRTGASLRYGRRARQRRVSVAADNSAETTKESNRRTTTRVKEARYLQECVPSQPRVLPRQSKHSRPKELQGDCIGNLKEDDRTNLQELKELPNSEGLLSENNLLIERVENRHRSGEKEAFIVTERPYFVLEGEDRVASERSDVGAILASSWEVPAFRERLVESSNSTEGTEDLCDDAFLRRHSKPEADEKRMKKWDSQRLREQIKVSRLKERQERGGRSRQHEEPVTSLLPKPELATHVQVEEQLPVTAFGHQLPVLDQADFCLPWKKERPLH